VFTIFLTDLTGYNEGEACLNGSPDTNKYVSGAFNDPTVGQFVYNEAGLITKYNGGSQWHKMSYSTNSWEVNISTTGEILTVNTCPP
jgi:hypothetical protein